MKPSTSHYSIGHFIVTAILVSLCFQAHSVFAQRSTPVTVVAPDPLPVTVENPCELTPEKLMSNPGGKTIVGPILFKEDGTNAPDDNFLTNIYNGRADLQATVTVCVTAYNFGGDSVTFIKERSGQPDVNIMFLSPREMESTCTSIDHTTGERIYTIDNRTSNGNFLSELVYRVDRF